MSTSPLGSLKLDEDTDNGETVAVAPVLKHGLDSSDSKSKPKNIPTHLWEKFKLLEKRTNDTIQRSTEKRIKHLQKKVLERVTKEFRSDEDKDILREHDVKFGPPVERGKKRKVTEGDKSLPSGSAVSGEKSELVKLISINDHLHKTDHSRPPPESETEIKLNEAIEKGDFDTAEALSDKIASFETGERLVGAFEAKRYLESKEREKETTKAKKKKKLHWGFEAKQRWETKGNM